MTPTVLVYFEKDLVSILKNVPNELDKEPFEESDGVEDNECGFLGILIGIEEVAGGVK